MSTLTTREVMYMINDIEHTVAACKKEETKMGKNIINSMTSAEVLACMENPNIKLENQEMVDAMKKLIEDKDFMHDLMLERPIIVAGIATTWAKAKSMSPALGVQM